MARQKPSEQVEALRKKQAALESQLREAQAKANAEAKETLRRKSELAGGVILKAIDALPSGQVAGIVRELLDSGLKGAADRALFGLPPRKKPEGGETPEGGSPPPALPIETGDAKALKEAGISID
jgi:hypothetical protein